MVTKTEYVAMCSIGEAKTEMHFLLQCKTFNEIKNSAVFIIVNNNCKFTFIIINYSVYVHVFISHCKRLYHKPIPIKIH